MENLNKALNDNDLREDTTLAMSKQIIELPILFPDMLKSDLHGSVKIGK